MELRWVYIPPPPKNKYIYTVYTILILFKIDLYDGIAKSLIENIVI